MERASIQKSGLSKQSRPKKPNSKKAKVQHKPNGTKETRIIRRSYGNLSRKLYKEIKRLQYTTHLLIPKAAFSRLVKEITQEYTMRFRYSKQAMQALQEATELYIETRFQLSQACVHHAKRATLFCSDMALVKTIQNED